MKEDQNCFDSTDTSGDRILSVCLK